MNCNVKHLSYVCHLLFYHIFWLCNISIFADTSICDFLLLQHFLQWSDISSCIVIISWIQYCHFLIWYPVYLLSHPLLLCHILYILSCYILFLHYILLINMKRSWILFQIERSFFLDQRIKYDECNFFVCLDVVGRILPKRYSSRKQEDQ